jgi:hypothetical protein
MQYEASGYLKVGAASLGISESRYSEIKLAKATCIFALEVEEKYALLLDNFFEFEGELLKLAEALAIWPNHDHEKSMLGRLAIDRRLVNLLTACRLYLDQTDHGISKLYGNPSNELADIKKFKGALYDANDGYRLMEALRNHVQHSGLPVHVISHSRSLLKGKVPNYNQYVVVPQTRPETLAENEGFKPSVLAELRLRGKEVDLRRPVRDYIGCMVTLHEKIRATLNAKVAQDRAIYELAAAEYSTINGHAVKFPHLIQVNEDSTFKEQIALVTEFLDYYDSLRKRNQVNPQLANSCASNSVQERA